MLLTLNHDLPLHPNVALGNPILNCPNRYCCILRHHGSHRKLLGGSAQTHLWVCASYFAPATAIPTPALPLPHTQKEITASRGETYRLLAPRQPLQALETGTGPAPAVSPNGTVATLVPAVRTYRWHQHPQSWALSVPKSSNSRFSLSLPLIAGAVYICTEDVFPNKRLQQLIEQQPRLRGDVPRDVVQKIKFGNGIFVEHAADLVSSKVE